MRRRLSQEEKERVTQTLRERLQEREEVRFAYLFGSFVLHGSFEDIDVAVYVAPEALQEKDSLTLAFELADALEQAVRLPVDVVVLNTAPLSLQFEAAQGRLLLARGEDVADFVEQLTWRWWETEGLRWAAVQ